MQRGFSLVELSIVLVILGLLTGGILAGQSLIRASEMRNVSTEYNRWITAAQAFRDKYFALPGDMTNAQSFWGTAAACPGLSGTPSTTTATCNGDGSGTIIYNAATSNESYRFWQHLANAGLIEGSYTGVPNHAATQDLYSRLGWNVPASKLNSAGWTPWTLGTRAISHTVYFDGTYGNIFLFGAIADAYTTWTPVLKPEEAWNIDTKMDDGKPATGTVVSLESQGGTATPCSDLAASAAVTLVASVYSLSATGTNCSFVFKMGI